MEGEEGIDAHFETDVAGSSNQSIRASVLIDAALDARGVREYLRYKISMTEVALWIGMSTQPVSVADTNGGIAWNSPFVGFEALGSLAMILSPDCPIRVPPVSVNLQGSFWSSVVQSRGIESLGVHTRVYALYIYSASAQNSSGFAQTAGTTVTSTLPNVVSVSLSSETIGLTSHVLLLSTGCTWSNQHSEVEYRAAHQPSFSTSQRRIQRVEECQCIGMGNWISTLPSGTLH